MEGKTLEEKHKLMGRAKGTQRSDLTRKSILPGTLFGLEDWLKELMI